MHCKALSSSGNTHGSSFTARARGPVRQSCLRRGNFCVKAAASAPVRPETEVVADVRKKISMVQLGCPKNTVDGKRFTSLAILRCRSLATFAARFTSTMSASCAPAVLASMPCPWCHVSLQIAAKASELFTRHKSR